MRTIRVAPPGERVGDRPATEPRTKRRASRLADWIATLAMAVPLVALLVLAAPTRATGPALATAPSSAPAGATVTVSGSRFAAGASGKLALDGSTARMPKYRAASDGSFRVSIQVPRALGVGVHRIAARAGGVDLASTALTILSGTATSSPTAAVSATPTPTPTAVPSATAAPTSAPTPTASATATPAATPGPVSTPTAAPTATPIPVGTSSPASPGSMLISPAALRALPTSGAAWSNLLSWANRSPAPDLANQDDASDVITLAKALVAARTGSTAYRDGVVAALRAAVGTEAGGRTLAEGRNLPGYVLAADLIDLKAVAPTFDSGVFRPWLRSVLTEPMTEGTNLVYTAEHRPNNWGTHAGAARVAISVYLGDGVGVARQALVFRGWLGDRSAYAGFSWGDLSWQCDPGAPVGVNPTGCTRNGIVIDGALPDDMRRGGSFTWPPVATGYPWEALQGATLEAELLTRAGYPAWTWQNGALRRAAAFLVNRAGWPASGDDTWQPWLIDHGTGSGFTATCPTSPGKNFGFTDWLYAGG